MMECKLCPSMLSENKTHQAQLGKFYKVIELNVRVEVFDLVRVDEVVMRWVQEHNASTGDGTVNR